MKRFLVQFILFVSPLLVISLGAFFSYPHLVSAVSTATVVATIKIEVCGDGVKDDSEECDGSDLNGQTCTNFSGFTGGTLSCSAGCLFAITACTSGGTSPGGGGGGGGGGGIPPTEPVITSAVFVGRAYPGSLVTLLKDGQIAIRTVAGPDANFQMTLAGLSAGNYIFSLYTTDNIGRQSSALTFPVFVTSGATTRVSGIFLAPTIAADKSEVKRGDTLSIFGQSLPQSEITVQVNSTQEFFAKARADKDGVYLYNLDTAFLEIGDHSARSKSTVANEISAYSDRIAFKVGTKSVNEAVDTTYKKADLNRDGSINLVDFSVAAYWYKRKSPPAKYDLNNDGKIDLVDFSIMAYYWTG
ncbi:MAG: hypothetical protein A2538_02565 [Candidatus Magasanikbacteria bacterium RIFOXYD2_FULL_41_14]|uniref:Dockerin domain-containing protein n=1 Tax=Candidatus Magasanikbacteria bacterium RIFOXYD2_FULL_41_14 TaxID=1798709 RepID=A0A1F6PC60_9BACT|nr:MAG: hypothetical protein A2538_02565 [Candidatus Magasanikbacteria bacterium RIFOXYD2_FULL_41_14]